MENQVKTLSPGIMYFRKNMSDIYLICIFPVREERRKKCIRDLSIHDSGYLVVFGNSLVTSQLGYPTVIQSVPSTITFGLDPKHGCTAWDSHKLSARSASHRFIPQKSVLFLVRNSCTTSHRPVAGSDSLRPHRTLNTAHYAIPVVVPFQAGLLVRGLSHRARSW